MNHRYGQLSTDLFFKADEEGLGREFAFVVAERGGPHRLELAHVFRRDLRERAETLPVKEIGRAHV